MSKNGLPFFARGLVVKGFGRGSKELGIPTANLSDDVVDALPREIETGIYFGFASIESGPIYRMVMSIGWNPYYKNVKKSMEAHILHNFESDFYGKLLKICIVGYLRPERNFSSLDDLITAIKADITEANSKLQSPEHGVFAKHSFFNHDHAEPLTSSL